VLTLPSDCLLSTLVVARVTHCHVTGTSPPAPAIRHLWTVDAELLQSQRPNSLHISNMAAPAAAYKDRQFLAVIGDEVWRPERRDGGSH
jgi:hypothetical protein